MTNKLQEEIKETFPELFNNEIITELDFGDGWHYLVYGLCRELQEWSDRHTQIVLCSLCLDDDRLSLRTNMDHDSEIQDMIKMYIIMSSDICNNCGEEHEDCSCNK